MFKKLFNLLFNKHPPKPTKQLEVIMKIQTKSLFISAGHSSSDPGAKGNGLSEADVVLEFRGLLAKELTERGIAFTQDGTKDQNLSLTEAIKMAKGKDIALEFHCNAFHKPSATGVETLSRIHHYDLGNRLNAIVSSTLGIPNRGAKGEASGQHSRLGFISKADGIIVELFFISNPKNVKSYQEKKQELASKVADLLEQEVLQWLVQ
jgi:N-acetylmuramoyl-L-alanine amidase